MKLLLPVFILFAVGFCASSVNGAGSGGLSLKREAIVLGEGKTRQLRWRISAVRQRHGSAKTPCIVEQDLIFGGYSEGIECGPPAPPGDDALFTQFSASFSNPGGPELGATTLGLVFAPEVVRISLDLEPGPGQTRRTRLLSSAQARKAKLEPFRYLAFGIAREVCVKGIEGFDSSGVQVFEQREVCGDGKSFMVPAEG